ncbi:mechanosensitive ion channel family protein [Pseudonocardia acaciae]|uniref:mechanosensitive ion channel family protein n=1 Tax=Pseudonocardia acaciae TaxID=551276 RepID=UPI0004919888|nr:mechanosensitive ion channel family protein [Pseudonocardia acaciae]
MADFSTLPELPSADPPLPPAPAPACASDAGSWCSKVFGWTHSEFLARSADLMVDRALAIALIVLLAIGARALLHRLITRLTQGALNGRNLVPGVVRRRAPAGLREMAARSERRAQRANTIASVLRSITSTVVLVIASIMVLAEFGLNLGPILASAGIVGVAIGFGAQNLVRDFLSGMFMLLEDQYGVGDVVDVGEASGTVEAVGLRITTLRDVRGTVWHVRNGAIQRVGNKSQGYAVAVVDLPLAHNADIEQATEIAARVAAEVAETDDVAELLLEPPEVLGVETVTVEGLTLRVTAKTRPGQQWAVQRALNAAISAAFDDADLERPYTATPPPNHRSQP